MTAPGTGVGGGPRTVLHHRNAPLWSSAAAADRRDAGRPFEAPARGTIAESTRPTATEHS